MMNSSRPLRFKQPSRLPSFGETGIENEQVLTLVFESISWDIHTICAVASVSRRFCAIARRVLWRSLCVHRAPGWRRHCPDQIRAGESTGMAGAGETHVLLRRRRVDAVAGSLRVRVEILQDLREVFLPKNCREISCTSKTRQCLVRRQAELEEKVRCPYCGGRVWSMKAARLVPKSAARRLGSRRWARVLRLR
ncbi:hypothetical protein Bca52824_009454 [Brassica carinata]|uniref:F-box domain-containing protein n=1 Tax=Brassica carinata TaxID=52824 RepID=A0A8X7WBV6_BRACI|nr:hypothetical protein Bca52824_009454 [Brassica carinata]